MSGSRPLVEPEGNTDDEALHRSSGALTRRVSFQEDVAVRVMDSAQPVTDMAILADTVGGVGTV